MREQQASFVNGSNLESQLSTIQIALDQQKADRDSLVAELEDARQKLLVRPLEWNICTFVAGKQITFGSPMPWEL